MELDLDGLDVRELSPLTQPGPLVVAYHRGKMEQARGTAPSMQRQPAVLEGADVAIGPIANDRMFVVLDRFFNGGHH